MAIRQPKDLEVIRIYKADKNKMMRVIWLILHSQTIDEKKGTNHQNRIIN